MSATSVEEPSASPREPASPADSAPVLSRARTNLVFVTILLGMLMAALDQTIVSSALPTIVVDLGGAGHMSWVVTAYLLAETISTVLVGKFGDLFGRKLIFQLSAVVFIAGSAFSGAANSMLMLIIARAAQGIGGGGLMVTAQALIADVIPLRQRGKYQGAIGAVFGVTTVLGPTLGGFFTDHASWRWCFYVNLPIAVIMIAMAARYIPTVRTAAKPLIDYAGIVLVAAGCAGLILALEWGGNEYAWGSGVIIGLFAGSTALLVAFVLVERRAAEPILPLHLFRTPVFSVCSVLSFIVGFCMMGAMVYLPTYLQYVDGVSATMSGLRTVPMVIGLLTMSMVSGQVISSTGKYKIFPIVGTATMTLGLFLLSTMGTDTGIWLESLYLFIFGLGLGSAMQVLTIAVQNTVAYHEMGTATSGVTFFRSLGSSFGTAIFGTLYTSHLSTKLSAAIARSGVPPQTAQSPQALHKLPAAQSAPIIAAYADSITFVFRWVVPVALLAFVVSFFLKQVPLRDSARAGAADMGDGFGAPDQADSQRRLEREIANLLRRPDPAQAHRVLAASGTGLAPGTAWALAEVHLWTKAKAAAGGATLESISLAHRVPPDVLAPTFERARDAGLLAIAEPTEAQQAALPGVALGQLTLTPGGQSQLDQLAAAWRSWLSERLDDWDATDPADRALLDRALDGIAERLFDEEQARTAAVPGA